MKMFSELVNPVDVYGPNPKLEELYANLNSTDVEVVNGLVMDLGTIGPYGVIRSTLRKITREFKTINGSHFDFTKFKANETISDVDKPLVPGVFSENIILELKAQIEKQIDCFQLPNRANPDRPIKILMDYRQNIQNIEPAAYDNSENGPILYFDEVASKIEGSQHESGWFASAIQVYIESDPSLKADLTPVSALFRKYITGEYYLKDTLKNRKLSDNYLENSLNIRYISDIQGNIITLVVFELPNQNEVPIFSIKNMSTRYLIFSPSKNESINNVMLKNLEDLKLTEIQMNGVARDFVNYTDSPICLPL